MNLPDPADAARAMQDEQILAEQTAFFTARGAVSDDWFFRRGTYDRGPSINRKWFSESVQLVEAITNFDVRGNVLELAGGTGLWTQHLVMRANRVTVVEVSPASIAASRARLGAFTNRVRYVEGDIFRFVPREKFDVVFFAFWISHVPADRFAAFWEMIRSCLAPGGRAFLLESLPSKHALRPGFRLPSKDETFTTRTLEGQPYRIFKTYYTPQSLRDTLAGHGWRSELSRTPEFFLYGSAQPDGPAPPHPGTR